MSIKKLLLVFLIASFQMVVAQNIPNQSFENWTLGGPFETPNEWAGSPAVNKTTIAHAGTYAVELKSDIFNNPMTGNTDTIPGRFNTGQQGTGPGQPGLSGYAFTNRPDSFTGWYKYSRVGNDAFIVRVTLWRWNDTTKLKEIIADEIFQGGPAAQYTRFSMPINYNSNKLPDSANIEFISSNSMPPQFVLGSVLIIDDLYFITKNKNGINSHQQQFACYPNPCTDFISLTGIENSMISIYNSLGECMLILEIKDANKTMIPVQEFPSGMYFIKTDRNEVMKFQKL